MSQIEQDFRSRLDALCAATTGQPPPPPVDPMTATVSEVLAPFDYYEAYRELIDLHDDVQRAGDPDLRALLREVEAELRRVAGGDYWMLHSDTIDPAIRAAVMNRRTSEKASEAAKQLESSKRFQERMKQRAAQAAGGPADRIPWIDDHQTKKVGKARSLYVLFDLLSKAGYLPEKVGEEFAAVTARHFEIGAAVVSAQEMSNMKGKLSSTEYDTIALALIERISYASDPPGE